MVNNDYYYMNNNGNNSSSSTVIILRIIIIIILIIIIIIIIIDIYTGILGQLVQKLLLFNELLGACSSRYHVSWVTIGRTIFPIIFYCQRLNELKILNYKFKLKR